MLKPKERSTAFGFTSNDPPVLDNTRVLGVAQGVVPAVASASLPHVPRTVARIVPPTGAPSAVSADVALDPDGTVPTPVALAAAEAAGGLRAALPTAGGIGGLPGVGGGFPGVGGIGGFGTPTSGGFPGGGGADGSGGDGTPSNATDANNRTLRRQATQQQQTPTPTSPFTNTNNVTVNVSQQQSQQQHQQQQQQCPPGKAVPEPAALLLVLLGLPFLLLFVYRRRATAGARG